MAAAALAAGVISSQAGVYSANIVGYVNTPLVSGYNLIANPLSAGVTNGVNEVFSNPNDGDVILTFTGSGYNQVLYSPSFQADFGQPSPWLNPNTFTSVTIPTVAPGEGFYYYNSSSSNTVSLVGSVVTASTNGLRAGYNLVGSALAIGGAVTNTLWNLIPNDGDIYLTFNGAGYVQTLYSPSFQADFGQPSPWLNPNTFTSVGVPSINVGQGFFYYNSAATNSWVQSLPSN